MKLIALLMLFTSSVWAKNLNYSYNQQSTLSGSWAEVVSLVAENISHFEVQRCKVLDSYFTDIGDFKNCCLNPRQCEKSSTFELMPKLILKDRFLIAGQWRGQISFDKIKAQINSNRPFIIRFKSFDKQYVALIEGYESNGDLHMIDPLEEKVITVSYDTLRLDGYKNSSWIGSYTIGY